MPREKKQRLKKRKDGYYVCRYKDQWFYSLDEDYIPVDKLCLYALEDEEDLIDIDPEEFIQYFSITSDYEIHLLDYSKTARKTCTEEVYYLDSSRHFVLQESESTN